MPTETREQVARRVREKIFIPSSPVRLREQLRGRETEFARTIETLQIPGRTVFIYGDRGVGKSSLAWTAAYAFNGADAEPIRVPCHPKITFPKLIAQIAKRMHDQLGTGGKVKKITEIGLKSSLLTLMQRIETENEPPKSVEVNDAVELLEGLMPKRDDINRVIVVDELDATDDPTFRSDVAYFIKQLGDSQARIKFIFAGIGQNVSDLLVHHESAQRCMATIKLEGLPMNFLRDIVVEGFRDIGIAMKDTLGNRIAILSDGFAHFTHLLGLKMALAALDQEDMPTSVDVPELEDAIKSAIADSEAIVKEAYDLAVQKYASYEPVLWAVADHWQQERSTREVYRSYERICRDLKARDEHVDIVERKKFSSVLNNLKTKAHGEALSSNRRSWFKIRISMLRGFCRLVAASKGIRVGLDYLQSESSATSPLPSLATFEERSSDDSLDDEDDREFDDDE